MCTGSEQQKKLLINTAFLLCTSFIHLYTSLSTYLCLKKIIDIVIHIMWITIFRKCLKVIFEILFNLYYNV